MDVATFGLWETIGTPVEGMISNNLKYIVVKAKYEAQSDKIIDMEVYTPTGKKYTMADKKGWSVDRA